MNFFIKMWLAALFTTMLFAQQVTITPQTAAANFPGQTITFSTNSAHPTWTVVGPGAVSNSGVYTVPTPFPASPSGTTVYVKMTDSVSHTSAIATVMIPSQVFTVAPTKATLTVGQTLQFQTSVTGATWSVDFGTITSGGLYTPPTIDQKNLLLPQYTSNSVNATVTVMYNGQVNTVAVTTVYPEETVDQALVLSILKTWLGSSSISTVGNLVSGSIPTSLLAGTLPASDITGLATSATVDATNAGNINSGILNVNRLPTIPITSISGLSGMTDQSVTTGTQLLALCATASSQNKTLMMSHTWDVNGTCGASIYAYSGGGFRPASGHTVTLTGAFDGDLTQHADNSAGGTVVFNGSVSAFYPQWFGPAGTCTGPSVDSTSAVQAAIDASVINAASRKVVLIGSGSTPSCGISAAGVTLYPQNTGMTLTSNASIQAGVYVAGQGGGLVATTSNPPSVLLTVMAPAVTLENLYLDGNNKASTNGVEYVLGATAITRNLIVRQFSGDGGLLFNEGTPVSHLTSGTTAGTNTVLPINATTVNRYTMGTYYCPSLVIAYGSGTAETVSISSISGNNVTVASTANNHITNETVQCHGNSNDMHFERYESYANGGWGWKVVPGQDNNSIYWSDGQTNNNMSGGELWSGGSHIHIGGNYEGDTGPAVQLGDVTGAYVTHFMVVGPLSDIEESMGAFNVVNAVCDDSSSVTFKVPGELKINTGSGVACPAYASVGTTTTGYGTGVGQVFYVKSIFGISTIGGGNVPFVLKGPATLYQSPNIAVICTGIGVPDTHCPQSSANNAIVAELIDPMSGREVSVAENLEVTLRLSNSGFTLAGGFINTLNLNNTGNKGIASHRDTSFNIATGYAAGTIDVRMFNGDWVDLSQ